MPLFSVVIPTYNRKKMLIKTVESVLGQTVKDFEIIIVDDGSTDGTALAIQPYLSNCVRYYRQENKGAQVARNYGFSKATGEYVCFLDSDDIWLPNFLEEVNKEYNKDSELGCVYCYIGCMVDGKLQAMRKDTITGWIYEDALKLGYITSPSFLVGKHKCFESVGEWDIDFVACQDEDMFFRMAKKFKFKLIPQVLGVYGIEYNGSDSRICKSMSKVANGWWTLWNKFESDTLQMCGKGTISGHFLKGVTRFIDAAMIDMAKKAYGKAVSFFDSEESMIYYFEEGIRKFVNTGNIYCYGAGDVGKVVQKFFKMNNRDISAFIVSEQPNQRTILGNPVYSIDKFADTKGKIIITTMEKFHDEIEKNIKTKFGQVEIYKIKRELVDYMEAMIAISTVDNWR